MLTNPVLNDDPWTKDAIKMGNIPAPMAEKNKDGLWVKGGLTHRIIGMGQCGAYQLKVEEVTLNGRTGRVVKIISDDNAITLDKSDIDFIQVFAEKWEVGK